jgi:hypothetical protein
MTAKHDVTLTYKDGKRQLTLDGERVEGVTSATITLPANDFPTVTVATRSATPDCHPGTALWCDPKGWRCGACGQPVVERESVWRRLTKGVLGL